MKLYMIKCEVCESPIVICKCEIGGYLFIKSAWQIINNKL
jgi:hypothetical protein